MDIAGRHRTRSWINNYYCQPTDVFKPIYGIQTFTLTGKRRVMKRTHISKWVNNPTYILIYCFITLNVCVIILIASPLLLDVCPRSYVEFLKVCPFDYTAVVVVGCLRSRNRFNPTCWVAVVASADRPKSARNRCVIYEVLCGSFVLSNCFLEFSVGVGAFVIGLSEISPSFSPYRDRGQMANPNEEVI